MEGQSKILDFDYFASIWWQTDRKQEHFYFDRTEKCLIIGSSNIFNTASMEDSNVRYCAQLANAKLE